MEPNVLFRLVVDLLLVLAAGLVSGALCKRLGISLLVGYLLSGAILGTGGLGLLSPHDHPLGHFAAAGALLLLFSIGIEFSPAELARLSRYFLLGGTVQMVLTAVPVLAACMLLGMNWRAASLVGAAAALSSTVLVFKALEERGQATSPHGRRAIGILLFQDAALVPLILLVPLLTGAGEGGTTTDWLVLLAHSAIFILAVPLLRAVIVRWGVPLLAGLRSTELVVLFTLTVLGGASLGAYMLGLPPAMGAFGAGLVLSGNRLSAQIDAIVLPYRETFAAVLFISLGTLMRLTPLKEQPFLSLLAVVAVLLLKTGAGATALRTIGLKWQGALGMGLGLAQLGEFSFMLLAQGFGAHVLSSSQYERMLLIGLATLILTPELLRQGLRWSAAGAEEGEHRREPALAMDHAHGAVVVGMGPIGSQVASQLELIGMDVCLIDLSPVNLHPFAQQGFRTVAGDASDPDILAHAGISDCRMAVITVPDDPAARQIVEAIRHLSRDCTIVVRCRYRGNRASIQRAGANAVVIEEVETSAALLRLLELAAKPG